MSQARMDLAQPMADRAYYNEAADQMASASDKAGTACDQLLIGQAARQRYMALRGPVDQPFLRVSNDALSRAAQGVQTSGEATDLAEALRAEGRHVEAVTMFERARKLLG